MIAPITPNRNVSQPLVSKAPTHPKTAFHLENAEAKQTATSVLPQQSTHAAAQTADEMTASTIQDQLGASVRAAMLETAKVNSSLTEGINIFEMWKDIPGISKADRFALQRQYDLTNLSLEQYNTLVKELKSKGIAAPIPPVANKDGDLSPDNPYIVMVPTYVIVWNCEAPPIPEILASDTPYEALKKNVAYTKELSKQMIKQYGADTRPDLIQRYEYQKNLLEAMEKAFHEQLYP